MSFIRLSVELLSSLEFEGLFLFIKSVLSRVSAGWCNRVIIRLANSDLGFFSSSTKNAGSGSARSHRNVFPFLVQSFSIVFVSV